MLTAVYAAIAALLYVALSLYVIAGRYKFKVGIGDGGHKELSKRIRIHANFIEYTPLGIIMIFLNEAQGASTTFVHILGSMLLVGRMLHFIGLRKTTNASAPRFVGMNLSFAVLYVGAVRILIYYFGIL